jgi:hypothetical protein
MLIEEAKSLSPGDKVIHDGDGIERTIVGHPTRWKVVLSPRLRGKGAKATQSLNTFVRLHSLKNGNGKVSKVLTKLPDPVELMQRGADDSDLYFIACKLVELKKAGAITLHNIRAEAYFACLEAEL